MPAISPGSKVKVATADGELLPRRATTSIEQGSTFEVVWVCKEAEWKAALAEQREPRAIPWPADAVLAG
jgi:hypothetical protein